MRLSDKSHIADILLFSSQTALSHSPVIASYFLCVWLLINKSIDCSVWATQTQLWQERRGKTRRLKKEKGRMWKGALRWSVFFSLNATTATTQNNEIRLTEERFWVPFAQVYCTYNLLCWVLLTRVGFIDVLCTFIVTEHLFCCIMHLKHN